MTKRLIRLAAPADAAELARLNARFNGEGLTSPEEVRAALESNGSEVVAVCEADGKLAGFACARVARSVCYRRPTAEITELYVEPPFRREGIARELVALLEARCKALGAEEFTILTGRDNAPAQALYRALGYVECDEVMFAKTTGA